MSTTLSDVETIFHEALKTQNAAERRVYVERVCADDADLRRQVQALLRGHEETGGLLDSPIIQRHEPGGGLGEVDALDLIGDRYRLLQLIGEGGFGSVYLAEQLEPIRREVALKIIKLGMDTKQVIARFEAEQQVLALMDHPNIATVLDAGSTQPGRPYFVMELVDGVPITEYCDTHRLSVEERLDLLVQVCLAIKHAHQKGIIHRDIKPSNVLVTIQDEKPLPKVIDFGIAKATHRGLEGKSAVTGLHQLVGTPEYMSPEQAKGNGQDVDTRTDIYSLGVLLYELLTGMTPFSDPSSPDSRPSEIRRVIRDVDPPRPSVRLASDDARLEKVAASRSAEPSTLINVVRGDLDWIVMKAMDKDRSRRYEAVGELGNDILRYLRNEPVSAVPPGIPYRVRKFTRRHRAAVVGGVCVSAALLAGLAFASVFYIRSRQEAAHSKEVSEYLQRNLVSVGFDDAIRQDESAEAHLLKARELFGDDHAVLGSLAYERASHLRATGRLGEAAEAGLMALGVFRRADDPDPASVAATIGLIAEILSDKGDHAEAIEYAREALDMEIRLMGPKSLPAARARGRLTDVLVASGNSQHFGAISDLWEETLAVYRQVAGDEHRDTVTHLCRYATWLFDRGQFEKAEPLLVEAVERGRRVLGWRNDAFYQGLAALLQLRVIQGDTESAEYFYTYLKEAASKRYGRDAPRMIMLSLNFAIASYLAFELTSAEKASTEAAELALAVLSKGDPGRLAAIDFLVTVYLRRGDRRAATLIEEAADEVRACLGERSPLYVRTLAAYGVALSEGSEDLPAAERLLREALHLARELLRPEDRAATTAKRALLTVLIQKPDADRHEIHALFLDYLRHAPHTVPEASLVGELRWAIDCFTRRGFETDAALLRRQLEILEARAGGNIVESFDDGIAQNFAPILGTWEVSGGEYMATGTGSDVSETVSLVPVTKDSMVMEFDVRIIESKGDYSPYFGAILRFAEPDQTLRVDVFGDLLEPTIYLRLLVNGESLAHRSLPADVLLGTHHFRIDDTGCRVTVHYDDVEMFSCSYESRLPVGQRGLFVNTSTKVAFDNFHMYDLGYNPDDLDNDGHSRCGGDCDDSDAEVHPGQSENCLTPGDDNCNGVANEGCTASLLSEDVGASRS